MESENLIENLIESVTLNQRDRTLESFLFNRKLNKKISEKNMDQKSTTSFVQYTFGFYNTLNNKC